MYIKKFCVHLMTSIHICEVYLEYDVCCLLDKLTPIPFLSSRRAASGTSCSDTTSRIVGISVICFQGSCERMERCVGFFFHLGEIRISIRYTLQEINISHLGKRKIIFKVPFLGDMLVPCRVYPLGIFHPDPLGMLFCIFIWICLVLLLLFVFLCKTRWISIRSTPPYPGCQIFK